MTKKSNTRSLGSRIKDKLPVVVISVFSVVLFVAIYIKGGDAQVLNTVITGGMWALLAVGLALVFGVMNIPHFAHGESFMIGAYVAFFTFTPMQEYLYTHPNDFFSMMAPLIAILAAGVAGAILGVLIEKLIFAPLRRRTKKDWVMNAFLLTVGISFVLSNGTNLVLGPNFRGISRYWDMNAIQIGEAYMSVDRLVAFAISMIVIGLLWFFLRSTRVGRAIRAVSQDETGALLVGINLNFIQTLTFSLATAMASISGASLLFLFQAYPTVGGTPLYYAWYVVMMAGLGNVAGAIIGGFIVALLQTATQLFVAVSWTTVLPTAVMILVLLIAPSGLFGSEVKGVQEQ